MIPTSLSPRAWTELMLLGLIWGASFLAIRTALDEIGPFTSVLWRTGLAAVLLWCLAAVRRLPLPPRRYWSALLIMGVLNNTLPFSLMAWGQVHIESGLTSILNATTAVFGVLAAAAFFADERLTKRRVTGVMLGFAGVVTIIGPSALGTIDITSVAQLAVLAGTVSYALASVWARQRLTGLPPVSAAAGMLTGGAVTALPMALMVEGLPTFELTPRTYGAIFYYAGVATALAYLLYYRVLAMAGAGNLMLVTLIIPPVAIWLGAWVRHETLPTHAFAGLVILSIGLLVLSKRGV